MMRCMACDKEFAVTVLVGETINLCLRDYERWARGALEGLPTEKTRMGYYKPKPGWMDPDREVE